MMFIDPGQFDTRAKIERPVPDTSLDGAGSGGWTIVDAGAWISIQDALPSRGEKLASGINIESRPARIRMRWRDNITADMRFVIDGREPLQIIAGPAMLGRRQWMEFMVEEYRPAGGWLLMTAFLTGLSAVQAKMRAIPDEMRGVLRGAARAGGRVFAEYIEQNTPSEDVREAVRVRTKQDDEFVTATVDLKPGWGRTVANWMEYGTEGHFISVDPAQRQGRSVGRINQQVREADGNRSLVIGGQFVGATVWHPGARPEPVFRPARDLRAEEAKAAAQHYIRARIRNGVIMPSNEGDED